jgi:hypothetical protein
MINELDIAIEDYQSKWQTLCAARADQAFFEHLKPTAVAWKVADLETFNACFAELRDRSALVHSAWINERWLATFYLDEALTGGLKIVKLMQRRPESADALGLDHFDFLIPENSDAKAVLNSESALKWTEEKNGDHCKWLSVWFAETEAKLRSDTVLEVCAQELLDAQKAVQGS